MTKKRVILISLLIGILVICFFIPIAKVHEHGGNIIFYSIYRICLRDEVLPLMFFPITFTVLIYILSIKKEFINASILILLFVSSFVPVVYNLVVLLNIQRNDTIIYDGIPTVNNGLYLCLLIPITTYVVFIFSNKKQHQ